MPILITGATGLIGQQLSQLFIENNIDVHYLSTSKDKLKHQKLYKGFYWNPNDASIDLAAFEGVHCIIHLAGENVFQPWTSAAKKRILTSRVKSTNLLVDTILTHKLPVKHFISASAIGIYASGQELHDESSTDLGNDFLAQVVKEWELASKALTKTEVLLSYVRIGIVLTTSGGALPQMTKPIKMGVGAALGPGNQWMSWIAAEDLTGIFYHIYNHQLSGVFNAVAPTPKTNREITKAAAKALGKKILLPNVPSFILKLIFGERAKMLLSSQKVSSQKIIDTGYHFRYDDLDLFLKKEIG
ncbi:MAG: TIGR01777 family oxidoreductase [Flavobacteriaceae bacterium]|nr:TIGR01777 family oxidoreductase [Flavobacteriaceae bacterium]